MGPSSKYAQEMTDKGNICFAQIVVFSHLIKKPNLPDAIVWKLHLSDAKWLKC